MENPNPVDWDNEFVPMLKVLLIVLLVGAAAGAISVFLEKPPPVKFTIPVEYRGD